MWEWIPFGEGCFESKKETTLFQDSKASSDSLPWSWWRLAFGISELVADAIDDPEIIENGVMEWLEEAK